MATVIFWLTRLTKQSRPIDWLPLTMIMISWVLSHSEATELFWIILLTFKCHFELLMLFCCSFPHQTCSNYHHHPNFMTVGESLVCGTIDSIRCIESEFMELIEIREFKKFGIWYLISEKMKRANSTPTKNGASIQDGGNGDGVISIKSRQELDWKQFCLAYLFCFLVCLFLSMSQSLLWL